MDLIAPLDTLFELGDMIVWRKRYDGGIECIAVVTNIKRNEYSHYVLYSSSPGSLTWFQPVTESDHLSWIMHYAYEKL